MPITLLTTTNIPIDLRTMAPVPANVRTVNEIVSIRTADIKTNGSNLNDAGLMAEG